MRLAYAKSAPGEVYPVSRKQALAAVRASLPDLDLLAFQTLRIPKADRSIPYLATFAQHYLRVLSVPAALASPELVFVFANTIVPAICNAISRDRARGRQWPSVIVWTHNAIHEVSCSDGGFFPDREEIERSIKKHPAPLCTMTLGAETAAP